MLNSEKIREAFYAYGQEQAGVEAIMRLHAVKRWHMIDTTRIQTLAEHSANVALLVYWIAMKSPQMFFGPALQAAGVALLHDLEEVFTGDIPSHTKRTGDIAGDLDRLADILLPREYVAAKADDNLTLLIKICDLVDGIRFIRLHGVDITSRHAREGLEKQLEDRRKATYNLTWPDLVRGHVFQQAMFYAYEKS